MNTLPNLISSRCKCFSVISTSQVSSIISNQSPNTYIENFKNSEARSTLKKKLDPDVATSSLRTPLKRIKKETKPVSPVEKFKIVDISNQLNHITPIKFVKWDANSCSFDVFLAEATIIQNQVGFLSDYLETEQVPRLQLLFECIEKINTQEFQSAQTKFIDYCNSNKLIIPDEKGKISILGLYENYYATLNMELFTLKLNISYQCKSKFECPYKAQNHDECIFDSIIKIPVETTHHNISESIQAFLNTQEETLCRFCYAEQNDTTPCIKKPQITSFPLYLKLGLESLFSSTNRVRRGLSKFQISRDAQILDQAYQLKSIVYFINFNHYNIEIEDPVLYRHKTKTLFKGWYIFDSLSGNFKKLDGPSISQTDYKISKQSLPLIITYEKIINK